MPKISVIITAHDRKKFIMGCLGSVIADTSNYDDVEILVVKNYEEPEIDGYLDLNRIRSIHSTSVGVGGKLADGIRASRGEIISFLEDDDLWEVGKMAFLRDLNRKIPDFGYVHNSYLLVDEYNNPIVAKRNTMEPGSELLTLVENERFLSQNRHIRIHDALVNMSSISISRRLVNDTFLSFLEKIITCPDKYMFYASYYSDSTMVIAPQRLTRFRQHGKNFSSSHHSTVKEYLTSQCDYFQKDNKSVNAIFSYVSTANRNIQRPLIAILREQYLSDIELNLHCGNPDKAQLLAAMIGLFKIGVSINKKHDIAMAFLTMISFFCTPVSLLILIVRAKLKKILL